MLNKDKDLKLYYSISEVAKKFGINESTLRFWEKEFPQLTPKRRVGSTPISQGRFGSGEVYLLSGEGAWNDYSWCTPAYERQ